MRTYDILSPVDAGKGRRDSGTIDLSDKDAEQLVPLGIVALSTKQAKTPAPPPPPPPPAPKALADQTLDELKATAKAEKVPRYGLIKDEAKLREAIEAHRNATAAKA